MTGRGTSPPAAVKWPAFGDPAFKRMAAGRALPWLDARGRDAAGLVALWDLSGDEALLKEAAEKYPDSPVVCIAMIGKEAANAAKALPWIERLLSLEPMNPYAWQLKAWALMSQKDHAGALAALTQAATVGGPGDTHTAARANTAREAALASGMSPGNAARIAVGSPIDRMTSCRVTGGVNRTIALEFEAAKAAGDEDRQMKITALGIVTADSMTGGGGPVTLREERMSNTLIQGLLADLPGDTELAPGGRSVAFLKSDLAGRREYLNESYSHSSAAYDRLRTGSDDLAISYADCFLTHGEQAAISSVLVKPGAEKFVP